MTIAVLCEKDKVVGAARFVQIKLFPARAIAPSLTVRVRICPRILFSHIPPLACFFSSTSLLELSVDTFCEGMKQRKGGWMDACGAFSSPPDPNSILSARDKAQYQQQWDREMPFSRPSTSRVCDNSSQSECVGRNFSLFPCSVLSHRLTPEPMFGDDMFSFILLSLEKRMDRPVGDCAACARQLRRTQHLLI
jgi:hypothetical protein